MPSAANQQNTRRARVEEKEEAIIATAHDIFLAKGYAKTTISEIAKVSGVADGTVYLYFKNKEAIARAVIASFYKRLTAEAQAGVDKLTTTAERVRFLATHHLTNVIEQRPILEMLFLFDMGVEQYAGSDLLLMNKAYVSIFDRVVKDGAARGEVRADLAPWTMRDIFYGSLDYGSRTIILRDKKKDIKKFVDDLMKLVLKTPEAAKAPADLQALTERLEQVTKRLEEKTR